MPLPLIPLIGAGTSLLGNLFNAGMQNKANQQQMAFQREQYNVQRQDSLSDWNMNNEYNSPTQQMMRLKSAGLNPHLVYGNGAQTTAQAPASSQTPFASIKAPQIDPQSAINAFTSLEANKAQVDNLRENIKSQHAEQALKDAQRLNTLAQIPGTEAQSAVAQGITQHQIEAAKLNNQKIIADTGKSVAETSATLSNAEQNVLATKQNIQKSIAEIIAMRINSRNQTKQTSSNVALQSTQREAEYNRGTESYNRTIMQATELTKMKQDVQMNNLLQEAQKLQNEYERGLITRGMFERLMAGIIDVGVQRMSGPKSITTKPTMNIYRK